jgi:hypothetical protein
MNNSSPQAQLFFQQFTSSSQTAGLLINGVTICETDEQVGGGVPPSNYTGSGMAAIEFDMTTDTNNLCKARH